MINNFFYFSAFNSVKTTKSCVLLQRALFCLSIVLLSFNSYGQCNSEIPTPFVSSTFDGLSTLTSSTGLCTPILVCGVSNEANLIDGDLTNFATSAFGISVNTAHLLRVVDANTVYQAGTFAGFNIAPSGGLLSGSILNGITIRTYKAGVLREALSGSSLLNSNTISSPGNYIVGFNTSFSFDAIEIVLDGGVNLLSTTSIYYAVIRSYCSGPDLECNTATKMNLPVYPMSIDPANTGISGVSLGSVINAENAVSSDDTDYATIDLALGVQATGSIAIKNQVSDFPAGTYAGVAIENSNLASASVLANVIVSTYLNGVFKEQFSGSSLLLNAALLNASGRYNLGFVTTESFDEVKLAINQFVGLDLGTTKVYGAIFEKFCVGPDLVCNTQTAITAPDYPVFVNSINTGIDGLACLSCSLTNQDNLIDQDLTNFAEVNLPVGVGTFGSLSVKDHITDYAAGTFAGYTIETPSLLVVNAFDAIRVTTFLNGIQQESKAGNGALVSVGTDLLVGTSKQTVGFVSSMPFDEVQITFENLVSVNLGNVKVYYAVFQKLCDPVVECNKIYDWSNPAFPVTINGQNTGIEGLACVGCAINNTDSLLTANASDFAQISLTASVGASGSLSVKDERYTYPKGTFAGFKIKDLNTLVQLNLFQSLVITTYNNGSFQESKVGAGLIDLTLLGDSVFGSLPGEYNVGFETILPFDEIRLTVASLVSIINTINVYGAFVDTNNSDDSDTTGLLVCTSSSISLTKEGVYVDSNADSIVNVGDTVEYVFTITNTGFTTLTNVSITDNNATVSGTLVPEMLAQAKDSTSYSGIYAITQADIDAGIVYNLATARATTSNGGTVTANSTDPTPCITCPAPPSPADPNSTKTPLAQNPKIALVKKGIYNGDASNAKVGDTITYTFNVTNTGNLTIANIDINDATLGVANLALVPSTLAPTEVGIATQNYSITQADIDAGEVTNTAIAKGQDPQSNDIQDISGTAVDNDIPTITTVPKFGAIALVKTGVYNGDASNAKVGDMITYTFTVTNTGNLTIANIDINDATLGVANLVLVPSTLAPAEVGSATQDYIITQADIDAGKVTNTAIAKGQDPKSNDVMDISGTSIDDDEKTITDVPQSGAIAFVKTGVYNGDASNAKVGDTITYTFTVTNTGNLTIANIDINDATLGVANLALVPSTLAPAEVGSATQNYSITQADIDAGQVTNTAIAKGQDPQSNDVMDISGTSIDDDEKTITDVPQSGAIALVKTGIYNGDASNAKVGDIITYTFTVTNTGNLTIANIDINDATLGVANLALVPSILAPAEVGSATQDYTITQADIDAGQVTNTAIARGQDPQSNDVMDISGTSIDDDEKTITDVPQSGAIALVKTGIYNGDASNAKVGDTITYTFNVTNTGNLTIANIDINDATLGVANLALVPSTLAPAEVGSSTQDYIITQADIDAGQVTNTAIAKGQDPQSNDIQDISGTAVDNDVPTITVVPQSGAIALVKTGVYNGDPTKAKLGDTITYTFNVTNTGNLTIANIDINDATLGVANLALVPSTLAPAEVGSVTQDYIITQADIDSGKVTNTAIAKGQDPQSNDIQDISGTAVDNDVLTITVVPQSGAIALVKTGVYNGDPTKAKLGDTITYTFNVTNTGNQTITNIVINDAKIGVANLALVPSTLAPAEVGIATQDYTITQTDIDAGKVTNTAIAKGQDPQSNDIQDISGTAVDNDVPTITVVPQSGAIALVKRGIYNGDPTKAKLGDTITYTFTVSNTGNLTIANIDINDATLGVANLALVPSTLAPAEVGSATQNYSITQADIDAGEVTNTAIAKGQDPQSNDIQDISGTAVDNDIPTITVVPQSGAIALVKTGIYNGDASNAKVGDIITYTFTVTNTGNLTIANIDINDATLGVVNLALVPSILAPSEVGSATQNYTITQADIDAGQVTNTAIAKGQDPQSNDVMDISGTSIDDDEKTITDVPQSGAIALVKTGVYNGDASNAKVGDTITYTFTVTNTGNLTIANIDINDATLGVANLALVPSILAPTEVGAATQDYIITQADIDAGQVTNTAIAKGQDPQMVDVIDTSGTAVDNDIPTITVLPQFGAIALVKTGVYNGDASNSVVGDSITYTFTVTNTGNLTIDNIVINDSKLGAANLAVVPSALAPGAVGAVSQSYTITQADIDAGQVTNSALAIGQDPRGVDVEDISGTAVDNDDPTVLVLNQAPEIDLVLEGNFQDENGDGSAQVGETIRYSFKVSNPGNVPLKDVWVEDVILGFGRSNGYMNLDIAGIDASTFWGLYPITQADIIAGRVINIAKANGTSPLGIEVQDISNDGTELVVVISGCTIKVFNAVSADEDGFNDTLYIQGIECYPSNTVQVFNRWGVKVFDVQGYDNSSKVFRGMSEGRVTANQSEGLPNGTYFYVLNYVDLNGSGISKSGYLHLIN
jgi:uncharacterized repeat protein (TIGR01451 family)